MTTLENYDKNEFEIEGAAIVKYKGDGGDVVIPDGVKAIGDYAFGGCAVVKSVYIPEGVEKLGGTERLSTAKG